MTKIKWEVIDKLLKDTESTPQDLLDWLEWGFENITSGNYICNERPYMDRFFLENVEDKEMRVWQQKNGAWINREYMYLKSPLSITNAVAAVWIHMRRDADLRESLIARFKKHYKL